MDKHKKHFIRYFYFIIFLYICGIIYPYILDKKLPINDDLNSRSINKYNNEFIIISNAPLKYHIIYTVGGLLNIILCLIWINMIRRKKSRNEFLFGLGCISFTFGTFCFGVSAPYRYIEWNVIRLYKFPDHLDIYAVVPWYSVNPKISVTFFILVGMIFIVSGYFMCFTKKK